MVASFPASEYRIMSNILSRLFSFLGGKPAEGSPAASAETREAYGDVTLVAKPMRDGNQFRIAGFIEKRAADQIMQRHFIRADVFSGEKEAVEFTLRKAKQIVDQHGASLFADGAAEGRV